MKVFYCALASILALLVFCPLLEAQNSALQILEIPKPGLPPDYGTLDTQGTITVKVEFLADGNIGKVQKITSLPVSHLDDLAVEAAKKIRFVPATKNGERVPTTTIVQYAFAWYLSGWKTSAPLSTRQVQDEKAEAIVSKAIQLLGGNQYLKATSQFGRGKYSQMKEGAVVSFQSFSDVIVYPDKERTEFKVNGVKSVQTNVGNTGWVFDGDMDKIRDQTEKQIRDFKNSLRVSLDNLLRGTWRNQGTLSYVGRRPSTLGRRNDVVRLTFSDDGAMIEFEFADDGMPAKAVYKRTTADGEEVTEEDRYAQFVDVNGIQAPFIIDRYTNGKQNSRINYETIEFNKSVPDSVFAKPSSPKDLKKDIKL